jgi:uncharacterized protein
VSSLEFLAGPARQAASLTDADHRPWPLPERSWVQGQTWDDLLFAHWRVDEAGLREYIPDEVPIDTHDGSAWLGITPFRVTGLRLRGMVPLPFLSSFLELNVRTYVTVDGKPGIWFFSLDAESQWVVEAARRTYRLPYYGARMSARTRGGRIVYDSARIREPGKAFSASYTPVGDVFHAEPGSLEWFLTERYCLYTLDERQDLARADIHHGLWPLQRAEADVELNTMPPERIELPDEEPLVHFSRRQDVVIWPLEAV